MSCARTRLLIPLGAVALLAACAAPDVPPTVEAVGMPNTELALRRSMDQVNADMGQLGGLEPQTLRPIARQFQLPQELEKQIQFQWAGPLDAGVRKLGDNLGYTVTVIGPTNVQPLAVSVNMSGQVVDALRALGDQAGNRATVSLDPMNHQITVIHHV